jgi:ABC-type polysaccharide/polyol phosphate transport system ATPase subunit
LLFDSEPAVQVDDLWVRFRTTREKRPTLSKRLRDMSQRRRSTLVVEALKGVTFDVPMGSVYGVIGRNGAGKSTLLRTIAGILRPTQGEVVLYRRVTPFLSLGIGFNRELTGRENILLGGLAAGLTAEQVKEHEQEIVDFAELGDAIDYPLRTYSSGMGGRLGFAVVSHLDPQIVLIDEALAAGDAKFKGRCRDKIAALCEGDCTVILVSHGLGIIKRMADQVLWIEDGVQQAEGPADVVVEAYLAREGVAEDEAAMEDM